MMGSSQLRIGRAIVTTLVVIVTLTACGFDQLDIPTALPLPKIGTDKESVPTVMTPDESPRQGPLIDLPPTWTPPSSPGQTPVSPPTQAASDGQGQQQTYIVQVGDTLVEIAIQFDVAVDELAQANNIIDYDHIEVGQELVIPSR